MMLNSWFVNFGLSICQKNGNWACLIQSIFMFQVWLKV